MRKGILYKYGMKQMDLLPPRLRWVADRVRQDAVFADIGTDHAKLPIALAQARRVSFAIASDIGVRPAEIAAARIAEQGLSDLIHVTVCDGLSALGDCNLTDIAVCGMGGETIVGILRDAAFIQDSRVRLLLQPMTDFSILRRYLAATGFEVSDEAIVLSDGRMYQCICATFCGVPYTLNPLEAELGRLNIARRAPLFLRYVSRRKHILEKQIAGKRLVHADVTAELSLLDGYNKILEEGHEAE